MALIKFDETEYENMSIEDLSQKLEELEKENEQKRRENQLFESYLTRNKGDESFEESNIEIERKGKGRKRAAQQQEKKELTAEDKYEIATTELEALRKNIEDGKKQSEELLEMLRAVLEETDMAIAEIKREAYEFKRDIVIGSENTKTGKVIAERLIKYMEEKIKLKDTVINKFNMRNQQLKLHINKANAQIKQKAEAGDDLKFIDFHQLQIENKKHVNEIDDRNKKMISLKATTTNIVEKLNKIKGTLHSKEEALNKINDDIENSKKQTDENAKEKEQIDKDIQVEIEVNKRLKQKKDKAEHIPSVMHYIKMKEKLSNRRTQVRNIQRKIDIAKHQYRKAISFLRSNNIDPNELMDQEPARPRYEGEESADEEEKSQELN